MCVQLHEGHRSTLGVIPLEPALFFFFFESKSLKGLELSE